MDMKRYEGKRIHIEILVGGKVRVYSGKVIEVDDSHKDLTWVTIIDKFDKYVTFLSTEIQFVSEDGE